MEYLEKILSSWVSASLTLSVLLTFIATHQFKRGVSHLKGFGHRWSVRAIAFACGAVITAMLIGTLIVFELSPINWGQVIYLALLVGLLNPFMYDLALITVAIFFPKKYELIESQLKRKTK